MQRPEVLVAETEMNRVLGEKIERVNPYEAFRISHGNR